MLSVFVRTNALLAVPFRGRYDKDKLYRMGYRSHSRFWKRPTYTSTKAYLFLLIISFLCSGFELKTDPSDLYPGPLGVIRSGRFGDCNNDNNIPMVVLCIKHIIVLSILFTSLSDVLYELMFCCVRL